MLNIKQCEQRYQTQTGFLKAEDGWIVNSLVFDFGQICDFVLAPKSVGQAFKNPQVKRRWVWHSQCTRSMEGFHISALSAAMLWQCKCRVHTLS